MRDIDAIIVQRHLAYPGVSVTQLAVLPPGSDDDGLWPFRHPATAVEVQRDSSTGACPFLLESSGSSRRPTAGSVAQAVERVAAGLGVAGPSTRERLQADAGSWHGSPPA